MKYWIDLDIDDLLATKISNPWIAILMLLYISSNLWLSLLIIEWSCKMLLSFFKSIYNSCSDLVDKAYFYGGMIFGQTKAEEEKRRRDRRRREASRSSGSRSSGTRRSSSSGRRSSSSSGSRGGSKSRYETVESA